MSSLRVPHRLKSLLLQEKLNLTDDFICAEQLRYEVVFGSLKEDPEFSQIRMLFTHYQFEPLKLYCTLADCMKELDNSFDQNLYLRCKISIEFFSDA